MRRWIISLGVVLVTTVGVTIYVHQPAPRSALGDAVGVRRNRSFGRYCGWFVRDAGSLSYPTGDAVCAWARPGGAERRGELDQMRYNALTRRVVTAERSWEPLSEQSWRRDVDSIRTALRAQGGVLTCAHRGRSDVQEYWSFPNFDVSLFTGSMGTPAPGILAVPPHWFLFVRGARGQWRRCDGTLGPPA